MNTEAIVLPELPEDAPKQETTALTIVEQAQKIAIIDQKTIAKLESAAINSHLETYRDCVRQINERIKFTKDHHAPMKQAAKAAHQATVDAEKKVLTPLESAKSIFTQAGTYMVKEIDHRAEIERQKEEQRLHRERQRKIEAAHKKIEKLRAGSGTDGEMLANLNAELESPEITEEEAEVIRSQIQVVEAKIAGDQQRAAELTRQAEQAAEAPVAYTQPAAKAAAPKGTVGRTETTVEILDIRKLCKGVADGILPDGVVTGVDSVLKNLAKAGMDLSKFGCKVKTDKKTHFR